MTDRLTPSVTDRADHVRHIAATSASLLQQLSTVDNWIFYMTDVNVFVFLTELINILPDKYFARDFCVAKSYIAVCFYFFWSMVIFGTKIFDKVVKRHTVANMWWDI